ncbi:xanthine dehydrogenase family protein molybdopterin-binding subunit [Rhodoplanes sp. Z2-YC6860]|uniref:xanthine dehydrogenase family protein molybdopterin-binding subunit n=1 Tax=Rhodoplanes sp. Z2-YC6860 TaxID=674703 RepID=UPI00078E6B18|nr:molybdopterin cofactor-binding domain-containing protein [Rhodoplanes sp. Z2-YC6860]AMN39837.1 Isoquinoline 1-oxidoreductase [Rhodoplanes sp. Z2-YC6860]
MTMMLKTPELSRRGLLAGLGGMTFCLALSSNGISLVSEAQATTLANAQVTPWVRIAPDGTVTILTAGAEMGQGSMTGLPVILAEELDCDWSKVKIEWCPADPAVYGYKDPFGPSQLMWIVGSRATQLYFNDLRKAGAQVRKVLIANAAQKWGVDASTLKTEPSVVINPANGARLSYGEIAAFGTIPSPLPEVDPKEFKARKDFRLIGKGVPRRDTPSKVNGTAQYAIDVKLPGMVYASTLHSPVHDAGPKVWDSIDPTAPAAPPESWNDAEVKAMPGIINIVKLPNGLAVVAEHYEQAKAGRDALKVKWSKAKADGFDSDKALESYVKIQADPNAQVASLEKKGDVAAAFAGAAKTYKTAFRSDYGYHAQMEPLNAVVRINGDKAEVWEGSQAPDESRKAVAKALGFKEEQVDFHQCYMGGGFGRRSIGDYAGECALIAKDIKRPVKLVWTREEDMAQGMFRPQSFQCLEAATDASGTVTGWKHCVVGEGQFLLITGIKIPYYGVPNQQIEMRGVSHGIRLKHWRSVGHVFNTFAIESTVDQMAADAGMDPIEFRFQKMAIIPKARKCFETVAQMCDWKAPRPAGHALGVSITERSGSLGAGVVEISIDRTSGKIKVHKVWVAVDGGLIVQPGPAKANVESAIIYGLSGVLHERISMKDGVVEQSNFHDYNVMRMSDLPDEMHVQFVDVDTRPTGLGEIGNPFIAGAISNAFFRLTGKRLRHLPFTPERVLEALKA